MSETIDDQQLKEIFYQEVRGLIDEMRKDLSSLREKQESGSKIASTGSQPEELSVILNRIFMNAHTIKSNSGIMGFKELRQLAEGLEKTFKVARDTGDMMDITMISQLSESVETCQRLLDEGKS